MTINFSSKRIYIRKIILQENESYYFFEGEYNIKKNKSYIRIEKLKFDKDNYKELYSKKLRDILIFSDSINNRENNSPGKKDDISQNKRILPVQNKNLEEINSLFGFIKFNMGYYAILASDSDIVGKIEKNIIYRVDKLIYFPLFEIDENFQNSEECLQEKKYFDLVRNFSYDKQIYFSYSYNLTNTVQRNFVENFKKENVNDFENEAYKSESGKISLKQSTNYYFCWNYFHIEEFFDLIMETDKKNEIWINYFIYGYFGQNFCNIKGLWLQISVIARRNRHFAGTRYLKRGITSDGNVANDVETEQILEEVSNWIGRPKISSFIQIRGSIPVYWFQIQNAFYQKPEIKVNLSDIRYVATKRHFSSLIERYGVPCIVCNLTKKSEDGKKQETLLNDLYYNGISYINDSIKDFEKIIYYHYDLKSERTKKNFYKQFYEISCPLISKTNLFSFLPNLKNKYSISLQNGVIRTNCIDCLDRTNVFQQILGIAVLIIQLRLIGINETFPENENETIYGILTGMYKKMGHELSNQYTGTFALKQSITDHTSLFDKILDTGYEIIIAIKRSMINYFNDQTKQNAMNLFLGKYKINSGEPLIWEMPCDDTLHKINNLPNLPNDWYKKNYEKYCKYNLFKDVEEKKLEKNIYIQKNFDDENINNKNNSKMSITSKLICKGLYKEQNNFKINDENYTSSNINEYIIDYSKYFQNKKETEEEEQFEEDSLFRFITRKKCLEQFNFNLSKSQNKNNNDTSKEDKEQKKGAEGNNVIKNFYLIQNSGRIPLKTNSFKRTPGGNTFLTNNIANLSPMPAYYENNKFKIYKNAKKLNLDSFPINDEALGLIYKFTEPISNSLDDPNLYELDNFDINEEDINKILDEKKNKNFEQLYDYETEIKKEVEVATEINDYIYYDLNTNTFIINNHKNNNDIIINDDDEIKEEKKDDGEENKEEGEDKKIQENDKKDSIKEKDIEGKDGNLSNEKKKVEENREEDNKEKENTEEENIEKEKKEEDEEKENSEEENNEKEKKEEEEEREQKNKIIIIKRIKLTTLEIDEDYFTEKEKQS